MVGDSTMDIVITPFTDEQVKSINKFQESEKKWHPFTCPNCGSVLRATNLMVQCYGCGKWMQTWVHRFMADWSWTLPTYYIGKVLSDREGKKR